MKRNSFEIFSSHYINIAEKTSGKPAGNSFKNCNDNFEIVLKIIKKYEKHQSILEIRKNLKLTETFVISEAKVSDINKLLKNMNIKKTTGPDTIPTKLVKISVNIVDSHLCNIINKDLESSYFSDGAKKASVRPIYKKKSRHQVENYKPVSILNAFYKIYEKYIYNSVISFVDNFLSVFISAYRRTYSSNHVLIKLIENWKQSLDKNRLVGAVLMDFSKAFDCIPHELLIAKMHAYGFDLNSPTFFYSDLETWKQNAKINNANSIFKLFYVV